MRAVSLIEPLEDRIAPAGVTIAPGGKLATYTDQSGDTVNVTTTKGAFTSSQFTFDPSTAGQLTQLTINGHKDFNGSSIVFSIIPVTGGSNQVNIGYIDAIGVNLASVTVPGDLGRIDVGGGATAIALGKLTVASLGVQGSTTQGGLTASTESTITGTIGTVNIGGNLDGALVAQDFNSKPGTGNIKILNIGGSLDGNNGTGAGEVIFTGTLGTAIIGGGIEGGGSNFSGTISGQYGTKAKIGSVIRKGTVPNDPNPNPNSSLPGTSILGGSGGLSGGIAAASVGSVIVAGDVFGGTGIASGTIQGGASLGSVSIGGSLIGGDFVAGDTTGTQTAGNSGIIFSASIGSVTIGKSIIGGSGLNSGSIISQGALKKLTVLGDVIGGTAGASGTSGFSGAVQAGPLGAVVIDGSLIGGSAVPGDSSQLASSSGVITSTTTIGSVFIGRNVTGGSGQSSGEITAPNGAATSIIIGGADASTGSVTGGAGINSGEIRIGGPLAKIILTHDLTGGSGAGSGEIIANGAVGSLMIGGNVTGGAGDSTGSIAIFGVLKNAIIQGGITGSNSGAAALTNTGYIQADGITRMVVGGALTAGTAGLGTLDTSGAIRSTVDIGSLTVGSLVGNTTNPAIISAVGTEKLGVPATTDVAIGSLTVKGSVAYADILAGYNTDTQGGADLLGTGVGADAQIGAVTIGGNFTATNIIAGVGPGKTGYGTAGSSVLAGAGVTDLPGVISKISKVIITGTVTPTAVNAADSFGIAAQNILSATVNGVLLPLITGPDNDTFATGKEFRLPAASGDVFLYEV